jgi:hypothetical protein
MNNRYLTMTEDSPEVLKGTVWAVVTVAMLVGFFLLAWLGIQREVAMQYKGDWELEKAERTADCNERDSTIRACNERISQLAVAGAKAETQAQQALDAKTNAELERDQLKQEVAVLRATRAAPEEAPAPAGMNEPAILQAQRVNSSTTAPVAPSAVDITNFVKGHLSRMMGSAESQLADYAEQVDFHDKPRASLQMIETDRESWAQKWPRRMIIAGEVAPQITVSQDAYYGWQATVVFNWRWFFWSRSGATARGVYHDTWRIVPSAQGMKIISEHSVDAATGRSRD